MKNVLACLLFVTTFIQCTTEQDIETQTAEQNLVYEQNLDLSKQLPNEAFNTQNEGLYVGTVVTNDLSFHQKIFINVNNDGHINAQIPTNRLEGQLLTGEKVGKKNNQYFFSGSIGTFKLTLENNKAIITNAIFDNKEAVVNVVKSTSTTRMMPSLGTFISNDSMLTGTWDLIFQQVGETSFNITTLTIVRDGGTAFNIDTSGEYASECIPSDAPGTFINEIVISCNGSAPLVGKTLNYNLNGFNFQEDNSCFPLNPNNINIIDQSWSLGTQGGTILIDLNSLPPFLDIT